jgi:hypothetical protein
MAQWAAVVRAALQREAASAKADEVVRVAQEKAAARAKAAKQ